VGSLPNDGKTLMKKELEDYLWDRISWIDELGKKDNRFPYDIIEEMFKLGMIKNRKQAWATLEKWTTKRIYEYGSRLDLGWKIPNRKTLGEKHES